MSVKLTNVSKKYCRSLGRSMQYGFRDSFPGGLLRDDGAKLRKGEFWSLRNINLDIAKGERVGVMGRNGAGKSTLMKVIGGVISPDIGTISVTGSIDQMIELTSGFAPSLSGRENARIYAKIKGFDDVQFKAKLEAIVEFAELQDAIDSPVRFYSSGMKARLGFALATMRRPEVLIVDEALAVGDLRFRLKCYEFLGEFLQETSFILVSHSVSHIRRFCNRGIVLEKGKCVYDGSSQAAIDYYDHINSATGDANAAAINEDRVQFTLRSNDHVVRDREAIEFGDPIALDIELRDFPADARITICVDDSARRHIAEWSSARANFSYRGESKVTADLGAATFNGGHYRVYVMVHNADGFQLLAYTKQLVFRIKGELMGLAPYQPVVTWRAN